ncbi:MAG TPA: hypothetical protein VK071_10340 [Tissierellales bacterium]|nr:hypothetical protein [Tissierellales bacterium]
MGILFVKIYNVSFKRVSISNVLGLIIGLILNGPIGLGTLIITVALGPLVGLFSEIICKLCE